MNSKERSKLKTRLIATSSRTSLSAAQHDIHGRSSRLKQTDSKNTPMTTATVIRSREPMRFASGTKEAQKKRTSSLKPLCQRSQQRHEIFRAEFKQKLSVNDNTQQESEIVRNRVKKAVVPRTIATGSLPPRLPSVKKTITPSAKNSTTRQCVVSKPSSEAQYQSKHLRNKSGVRTVHLSPPVGQKPPPLSTRGASCGAEYYKSSRNRKQKRYSVQGGTPPAEVDVDSEQINFHSVETRWRSPKAYNRHQTNASAKQQYRLKSQQLQIDKMKNMYRTRSYDISYEEVDSPLALYDKTEEDFDYA
eukprot:g5957.t1